jgi:MFS family permease
MQTDADTGAGETAEAASRRRLRAVFLTVFLDIVGFSIVFPLFPSMLRYYLDREGPESLVGQLYALLESFAHGQGADGRFLATVLFGGVLGSLYALLQFLAAPVLGRLSDRRGRRPVLLITIAGHALGYLLWVFAGSFALLVLSRILSGAMSGNIAVASAAIADTTTRENRARGMALIGVAFGLGLILGPALGGLTARLDLSALAPGLAPLGLNPFSTAAIAATLLSIANFTRVAASLPETLPPEKRARPREDAPVLATLASGAREIRLVVAVNLLATLALGGLEFTLTFLAAERLHYGPAQNVGLFLFIGLLLILVQGLVVRRLAPRLGERRLALVGLALALGAFVGLALAHAAVTVFSALAFYALGAGLIHPSLSALVSLYSSEHEQGKNLGSFRAAASIARAGGPLIAALAYWQVGSRDAYLLAAAMMLAPLALSLRLPEPRTHAPADVAP